MTKFKSKRRPSQGAESRQPKAENPNNAGWVYGLHPVRAVLGAQRRQIHELLMTAKHQTEFSELANKVVTESEIAKFLPPEAVHQGIAVRVGSLPQPDLSDVLERAQRLVLLDQVTDPHNLGAILRSCAAFDIDAVVVPKHGSAPLTSVVAKSSVGALELVPVVTVTNLNRTIERVQEAGFQVIGLAGESEQELPDVIAQPKQAVVMGSEGEGLRQKVAEKCDVLVRIPMSERMESLNVSVATGITLYSLFGHR